MVLSQTFLLIKAMSDIIINAFELCHRNEKREGKVAIADLSRLSQICASNQGTLTWRLAGSIGRLEHPQLHLEVAGKLELVCQRCMEPLICEINSQTVIILARDDDAADEIEALLDDEDPTEVIVGEEKQDVLVLVEDEVLLSIPFSPMHENCQEPSRKKSEEGFQSPFAVLGEWKRNK